MDVISFCFKLYRHLFESKMLTLKDFEDFSLKKLSYPVREFFRNGAVHEETLRENIAAMQRIVIKPRFLNRDVSKRCLETQFLGSKVSIPVGVAPTALQKLSHPDGEIGTAKACQKTGCVYIMSTMSTTCIEDVTEAAPQCMKWLQLYVYKDRDVSLRLIRRGEKCGFKGLVVTVDTPFVGIRLGEARSKFHVPPHLEVANFKSEPTAKSHIDVPKESESALTKHSDEMFDSSLTWKDIEWLKSVTKMPVLVKGILTSEDALLAVKHGVDGIIVSNHGGRQLDSSPATIEALPEIVRAAGHKCEVYVDGGFRTGTDILKALAIGARGVFLGRPILYGLAYGGEEGVEQVLNIVKKELDSAMALSGCAKIEDINRSLVGMRSHL